MHRYICHFLLPTSIGNRAKQKAFLIGSGISLQLLLNRADAFYKVYPAAEHCRTGQSKDHGG